MDYVSLQNELFNYTRWHFMDGEMLENNEAERKGGKFKKSYSYI